jgi:spore maturation protein CgeB
MRWVCFYHSLVSDWNHGNAHFLRGFVTELLARGEDVQVHEPADGWSRRNLIREHGPEAVDAYREVYPHLESHLYDASLDLERVVEGADVVLVHEWNEPSLVRRLGELRRRGGRFRLLFHDTHHRAATAPEQMEKYDLSEYDGVLAFGEVIRQTYLERGWARRAWTWHEAADVRTFRPLPRGAREGQLVWIGNWGDGERAEEIREFLLEPARHLGLIARVHGVRYPAAALAALEEAGVEYRGWVANFRAPEVFAKYDATVHVPRRPYRESLPGIPTIRVFEALACGIPLITAPWDDCEGLFRSGRDFLVARNGTEMREMLSAVLHDGELAGRLARSGLETILARHTCSHRVDELLAIVSELRTRPAVGTDVDQAVPAGRITDGGRKEWRNEGNAQLENPSISPFLPSLSGRSPAGTAGPARRPLPGRNPTMNIAFFGSSLVSAYWNGAATYYRGLLHALSQRGHRITFYEPDAYGRQEHRDMEDPEWAEVVVYSGTDAADVERQLGRAAHADFVVKASGVGVFDELLEREVPALKNEKTQVIFWDVDAPATLERLAANPDDAFHEALAEYDLVLTYGGGPPVVTTYERLGARECIPIYNALDPATHHRVEPDERFQADLAFLGNRLPDREARVGEFFLRPANALRGATFLLGGSGWGDTPLPQNVRYRGHVYTHEHNAFNCTPQAVLNVSRASMARFGYSPATRVFEAAGAAACIITDAWEGIEIFLEPDTEILVAEDGNDVARHLESLTPQRAAQIGLAARRRVLAAHTYAHRALQVEEVLMGRCAAAVA